MECGKENCTEHNADYKAGKIIFILVCLFLCFLFVFLLLYHFFDWSFTGKLSSCYVNEVLHLYCPGCGGTRALDYLLHGRLFSSFAANPLPVSMLLFFLTYFIPAVYTFLIKRNGNLYYHFHKKLLLILILFNIGYFLLRNASLILFHYDFIHENTKYWIK